MKKTALWVVFAFALITCNKKDPAPQGGQCIVTGYTKSGSVTDTNPYTYTNTQTNTYNSQNLLAGYDAVTNYQYASGAKTTSSISRTYAYDANGFVTTETYQSSDNKNGNYSISDTYNYEYSNNVRTKSTQKNTTVNGSTTSTYTSITIYEYTNDGKISKVTTNTTFSNDAPEAYAILYEYTNGLLSKITEDDGAGGLHSRPVEVNSQGWITKEVYPSIEYRHEYDADGNPTRTETWLSNQKTQTTINEYDTKQNINQLLYPTQKGAPPTFYGNSNYTHNITRYSVYNGSDVLTGETLYTYEYNNHGYPVTQSYTSTSTSYQGQASTTYTYKDCQ